MPANPISQSVISVPNVERICSHSGLAGLSKFRCEKSGNELSVLNPSPNRGVESFKLVSI